METILKQTVHLTAADFKEKVFNYETNKEWKYEGTFPAIVDFYADWCQPCKMVAPVLEDLAREYAGKIMIYKVNTEKNRNWLLFLVSRAFRHCFSFQKKDSLRLQWELLPRQSFEKVIQDVLLKN